MSSTGKNPLLDTEIVSMDDHERYEMRRCISLTLARRPYSASFMLMEFIGTPNDDIEEDWELEPNYMELPPFLLYDRVDAFIIANENVSDWEIHDYIVASNG